MFNDSDAMSSKEKFATLPFGSIKPSAWLKAHMQKDIDGFVGNLPHIVPDLINDPIYGTGRLGKHSKVKDLGNLRSGDAEGDEQYKWWNSETQSNWWDGYLRHVFLLEDAPGIKKVNDYVASVLQTQDADGYLGIYDEELRYAFHAENGELWSKTTLFRGLLAYYECTQQHSVLEAVIRAVDNVMEYYPMHDSSPFESGEAFNGGVSHGLTFTDILERLYILTGNVKYRAYAVFLYDDFSRTYQSEADAQLKHILDPHYQLRSHGVHTFEHIRALIIAAYASDDPTYASALQLYLEKIKRITTISGGAMGDEWILERPADATHTGYEYCSIQELLDSYALLLQKTGSASVGDAIEHIFFNAAQGSRDPHHSAIAYLKTDNSYEMSGTRNGELEPDRVQTRYKYSPAHQDVAVCCSPNAGRITPYFLQHAWMKENEHTLVATLLMPNIVQTALEHNHIRIELITEYPYQHAFSLRISLTKPARFTLKIRKPAWVTAIHTNESYTLEHDYLVFDRMFASIDQVRLSFDTEVLVHQDALGAHYFTNGALMYALPIPAREITGRSYAGHFVDYMYQPMSSDRFAYAENVEAVYTSGRIHTRLRNKTTDQLEDVELMPFGQTILRQVTF